ncbi:hypothetical protein AK830_g5530 [Neonectria ditissima]|uniref:FAD-binding PCMH-type domain-containing protein n=1 Tax=Neonectria ditissima TaxID=78410 RepID=A0A0P7B3N3_9HYPO|nr:hypothetical protein AK830_g5530 [Neonectria ditissima]
MTDTRAVAITYVPADCGSIIPGKSKAPKAFQDVGIAKKLCDAGLYSVSEHHALDTPARYAATGFAPGSVRNEDLNISVCQRVFRTIRQNLTTASTQPPFQLVLGGECCMLPAILSAFWQWADTQSPPMRLGLIYIDADTDLTSPTDSDSTGFFAGMKMTHLIRVPGALKSMDMFSRPSGEPVCDATNTVLFGTNMSLLGNKNEHFTYLFDNNYKVISSASVAREPEQRAREALKYLEDSVDIIMVHLDVDSIDPQMFPLANVPNFTGVTFESMMQALKVLLDCKKVRGLTVAEVNPDHDPDLEMVEKLVDEIIGMVAANSSYCLPGDACFPSAEILDAFNASVDGRLLKPQPYGAACYRATYDSDLCRDLAENKTVAEWRVEQPAGAQYPNVEIDDDGNGCAVPDLLNGTAPKPVNAECTYGRMARYVVNATHVDYVVETVRFAAKHNLRFRVKITGHCFTGRSLGEGSFSLWTHNMRDIELRKGFTSLESSAAPQDVFSVGPGVSVEQLYRAAGENGYSTIGGLSPTVGASGGWVLGGGSGSFASHFGLGVDNVVQFEVVTTTGERKTVNEALSPDLFWALRGGGGAFAVVTRVYFKAHPAMEAINTVAGTIQCQDKNSFARLIDELVELQISLREAGHSGAFSTGQPSDYLAVVLSFKISDRVKTANETLSLFDGVQAVEGCVPRLQALQTVGSKSWVNAYDKVVLPLVEGSVPVGHSLATLSRIISEDLVQNRKKSDKIKKYILEVPAPMIWQNTVGGAVTEVKADALIMLNRPLYTLNDEMQLNSSMHPDCFRSIFGEWDGLSAERLAFINTTSQRLTDVFGSAVYYNEKYGTGEEWQQAQSGSNYAKLLQLKDQLDPSGFLQCRNCVGKPADYLPVVEAGAHLNRQSSCSLRGEIVVQMTAFKLLSVVGLLGLASVANGLGQKRIISFDSSQDAFQIVGGEISTGQIRVSQDEYWGVIRAAGDLAVDFGRVTGTNFTLSNGETDASPAKYSFRPVDAKNNTKYRQLGEESFSGPAYSDPIPANVAIIAGTIGHSKVIDQLIEDGLINVSEVKGKWEAFVSQLVKDPLEGTPRALVIAGNDPRGTIYGLYDISEQIGVSPWYWWADVPIRTRQDIYVLSEPKVQQSPSVKYRGIFLNDEQPGLSSWVGSQWEDTWNDAAPYNHQFYALVSELLLRLRANYIWPTLWGSMVYIDDPFNQPLLDAYEIVLGGSHTEPMMRAQNEFRTFYEGEWQYNTNNETIDDYFRYGVERTKPYARNSLWTMAMRGTGDTAIEGNLGIDAILKMLEALVHNQRIIIEEGLGIDNASEVPSLWCLYKEVQSYQESGLVVPEDITLLWADDNWGNIRRLPLANETERSGGAGVYYHFDFVGDPRDYKWINTIQLQKTAEQMHLAYQRNARRIWIVNVGDLKPYEIPISQFLDLAYDIDRWGLDGTTDWIQAWAEREFGEEHAHSIADIITRYGMYAARRKFELLEPHVYSVINYLEAEAILQQWAALRRDTQAVYDALEERYQAAFFQMLLHPVLGGEIVNKIQINGARNHLYAGQKRNSANDVIYESVELMYKDSNLTQRWNEVLDGKWAHMLDQTHLGYDGYWQQPMRNSLPDLRFVQDVFPSLGGQYGIGVEGSNASVQGDSQWHSLSSNDLYLPPLDPWGPTSRYIDVFHRGPKQCNWFASPWESFVKLSQYNGTVGGDNGTDSRIYVTVDWENVPTAPNTTEVYVNFTSNCRGFERYAGNTPRIVATVINREVPENFTQGFVESDGYVSIEAPHYQSIVKGKSNAASNVRALSSDKSSANRSSLQYHTLRNYGRTLGGVTLLPLNTEKLEVDEGPALEYNMYLFSNHSAVNVTLFISPATNYLGDNNPLEYAIVLFPSGGKQPTPTTVQPIGPNVGSNMPEGWGDAVADSVWGLRGNYTTSSFEVPGEGAYTLRVWALLPNLIIQKIVVDLGGVRESYLGPPESFLVGRDEAGRYNGTSFLSTPDIVGGLATE